MDAQAVKALYEALARIISARGDVTVRVMYVQEKNNNKNTSRV